MVPKPFSPLHFQIPCKRSVKEEAECTRERATMALWLFPPPPPPFQTLPSWPSCKRSPNEEAERGPLEWRLVLQWLFPDPFQPLLFWAPYTKSVKEESERAEERVAAPSPGGDIYSPQVSNFAKPCRSTTLCPV